MARKKTTSTEDPQFEKLTLLMDHYSKGRDDVTTRDGRKNGWKDVLNTYMGKLPSNWPYTSMVTDPRVRTTILEKTARLLNAKLQGRLIPREGGDVVKALINNAILDYQWDAADTGGSMIEKVALSDQIARIYGAAFVLVYWNNKKNTNDIKVCDPHDIWWDFAATHARNAKWAQYREWTSLKTLKDQGYDVSEVEKMLKTGEDYSSDLKSTAYVSVVKSNRGLEDRTGQDLANPILEVIHEITPSTHTIFLPRYGCIIHDGENVYKHKQINIAQLRYYPLGDDIYGESEVESVIPLQRAINATLCGFIDEMNLSMRPPLKLVTGQYQKGSIEYGPGAQWVVNNINAVQEAVIGQGAIQNFNTAYPALVAAFNTAMGSESLGTSNVSGTFTDKTATEVKQLATQQSTRDQYNQLYLSEFLKDIMMMWLSNNKQYLFDDPTKKYFILKIIGKDKIKQFQQMFLDDRDIPDEAMQEIEAVVSEYPDSVTPEMLNDVMTDVSVPSKPVITNPDEEDPENYDIKQKLEVNGDVGDLYVTPDDLEGVFDYVPDVKSMSASAGVQMQQARQKAVEFALNPQVGAMLQTQGEVLKIKELLSSLLEDAGYRDADSLFQSAAQPTLPGGVGGVVPGVPGAGVPGGQAMAGDPSAQAFGAVQPGLPQTAGQPVF